MKRQDAICPLAKMTSKALGVAAALAVRGNKLPRQVSAAEIRGVLGQRGVDWA